MDKDKLLLDDPEDPLVWLVPGEQALEHEVMGFLKAFLRDLQSSKPSVEHLGECHGEAQVLEQHAPLMAQQIPRASPDLLQGDNFQDVLVGT